MNNLALSPVFGTMSPVIYLLVLIDLVLKGVTLYKSARREQKVWFVALLLVNSLGILPIIYLIANKDILRAKVVSASKKMAKKTRK